MDSVAVKAHSATGIEGCDKGGAERELSQEPRSNSDKDQPTTGHNLGTLKNITRGCGTHGLLILLSRGRGGCCCKLHKLITYTAWFVTVLHRHGRTRGETLERTHRISTNRA